uniref:Uncharacterized protein n=1 Tax=Avena sativa TaxID=4498 RepID=A0ACD5WZL3_AVESA
MEMYQGPSTSVKKLQVKAYAKVDPEKAELLERQGDTGRIPVPVMVSITAPSGMEAQREPVDLVVVLHVRKGRNVPEKWQELLKVALEVVTAKLDTKDCLAVVPCMPNLLPMSQENAAALLSQYKPDSIKTNTSLVVALESAESIFNGRAYEDKKTRAGYIVVISNSEDDMTSLIPWRFLSVHAFGFRDARNAWTIHSIASSRDCNYAILDDELGRITQAFVATIDRITSAVAVMPIEIQLRCTEKVQISGIGSPRITYSISENKRNATIWPRAHLAGVPTNFIVNLHTGYLSANEYKDLSGVLTIQSKYYQNPGASRTPATTTNIPEGQHGVGVGEVLDGKVEVVTVTEGMYGSKEMAAEMVRLEAVKIIDGIIEKNKPDWDQLQAAAEKQRHRWTELEKYDYYGPQNGGKNLEIQEVVAEIIVENKTDWEKLGVAAEKLRELWTAVKDSRCGREAGELISRLSSEMQEMEIRLYNNYMWPEYLLSWKSHQWWQLPLPPLFMDKLYTEDDPLLRLRNTAMVDYVPKNKKGFPVLVRVVAPQVGLAKVKRAPVDVVVVLDTEKKTNKKLEMFIKAMDVIMDKLGHQDRIAIIMPFQTATTQQPAASFMNMSKQGRKQTAIKLKSIVVKEPATASPDTRATQTTHWRHQLSKLIKFIPNCLHIAPTNPPIHGPTSSRSDVVINDGTKLWKALMDAAKILDNRREKGRLGFIIVISDSNGDFICQEALMLKYTVMLLASVSVVVTTLGPCTTFPIAPVMVFMPSSITGISNSSSKAALLTIDSGKFKSVIGKNAVENSIFVGSLYAGAVRNFIVYVDKVDVLHEEDYANFSKLFNIHIKWFNEFNKKNENREEQVVIVRDGTNESKEAVMDIIVRIEAVKIIQKVTNPNYNKKVVADKLQNICHGNSRLVREIQTMVANMHMDVDILSHMLSWQTFQGLCEHPPIQ